MGWLNELGRTFKNESGLLCAVFGLACAFTSMNGMRLNTLDGIYPIEVSLIVRHFFGFLAAIAVVLAYRRRKESFVLSGSWRRVMCIAVCFSVSMILRYSEHLLTVSSPALVLVGKLLEEVFGVLLILAWAERILPHGIKTTIASLSLAIVYFAGLQLLFSFFQKVPCMFALSMLPVVSAVLFKILTVLRPEFCDKSVPAPACDTNEAGWPVDLSVRPTAILYYGILLCFVYVVGQIVFPTLEIQQSRVLGQLSIALGNALGGFVLLTFVDKTGLFKTQTRMAALLIFFALFALDTVAFALMGHLNTPSTVLYLMLASAGTQIATVLMWIAPFAILGESRSPLMMVALGYGCNLLARTFSNISLLLAVRFEGYPFGIVVGAVLLVAFILCVVFVMRVSEGQGAVADLRQVSIAPFKSAVAQIVEGYGLTIQEGRVLDLCAKGKNAQGIAEEMTVSPNTAKSHLRALYAKLGVHSQQEVIKMVDDAFRKMRE